MLGDHDGAGGGDACAEVVCGRRHTAVRTRRGRVFVWGRCGVNAKVSAPREVVLERRAPDDAHAHPWRVREVPLAEGGATRRAEARNTDCIAIASGPWHLAVAVRLHGGSDPAEGAG